MPSWCSVSFCGNRSDKTSDVTYHKFPKNEEVKKLWRQFCERGFEWVPSSTARICSSHFRKLDFERNLQSELIGGVTRKILKRGAVPSIINESGEEPLDENKENQEIIENIIRNIDKEEEKRKIMVSTILEQATEEQVPCTSFGIEEQVPSTSFAIEEQICSTSFDNQSSVTITHSPEVPNLDYKTLYTIILEENNHLRKTNLKLTNKIQQTQQKLRVLEKRCYSYKNKLLEGKMREKKIKDILGKVLSDNQINLLLKKKKRVNWRPEEVATAFTLRYYSRKSYLYLKNHLHYPLPSLSSLGRWAMHIQMKHGVLPDILKFMQLAGEDLTEMEKCVVIQYDEIKVKSILEYDIGEDEIVGPHNYMQVVMVRGLFSKWKQPIFIDFDRKMTKDIVIDIIIKLYEIGYTVVACVSDCGGGNVGLWKELDVDIDKPYFSHPNKQSKIYMFADAPHLLKLVRNWLIDTGFVLEDGTIVTKSPLENLVQLTDSEVNVCFKICEKHLKCEKTARQNVRLAAELLSHTTATALQHYDVGNKHEALALSEFIEAVNKWFDVFNSYIPINKIPTKSAYGTNIEEQNEVVNTMKNKMSKIRAVGKKNLQTFQKGIIMSINSLKMLYEDMNEMFSASYILTHRLNQDSLENFFFQVRSGGGVYEHPSPLDALSRVRMIILGKNPGILEAHTSTEDRVQDEYMVAQMFQKANVSFSTSIISENVCENESSSTSSASDGQINPVTVIHNGPETTKDALEYIAGYIAKKYKKKYSFLGDHTYKDINEHDYSLPTWVHHLSYGGLMKPTNFWMSKIEIFNTEFVKYHKSDVEHGLRKGKGLTKKLIRRLSRKHSDIPKEVIQTFVKLRTIIRIKYINTKTKFKKRGADDTDGLRSKSKKIKKIIK